jgi:nucleoside-diphosphate-sugar epimerase
MRILIVGNLGYIGPVIVRHLRHVLPNAELIGYDIGYFGHCLTDAERLPESFLDSQIFGDIRTFPDSLLAGVDAVVDLAAISNDPMGNQFEAATRVINRDAAVAVAAAAKRAGVRAFVFASSCSVYGAAADGARVETSPLDPLTAYARSKVGAETSLGELAGPDFCVTCLRFATACGWSPRLRLDLVLNDFVACAMATKRITILSDGTPWRPLIHVDDMARAIEWAVGRPVAAGGAHLVINAGSDDWNYQVKDLAYAVAAEFPGVAVQINTNAAPDKRSYKVSFAKYRSLAPMHQPKVGLKEAIQGLAAGLIRMNFNDPDFRNSPLVRLHVLRGHLSSGRLNATLEWNR